MAEKNPEKDTENTSLVTRDDEPRNPFARKEDDLARTAAADAESSRAIAQVQAALVIARRYPRDPVKAMDLILQDCTLPKLAEAGTYEYARGGTNITGASIRLAEAVCRRWGNLEAGVVELSRHGGYSECLAYAWDLETGYREVKTFQVRHWRDTQRGGYEITDERDIYELVANVGARRKRACILAIIPMDVVENAVSMCEKTLKISFTITDETIAELLTRFEKYKVTREMIEKRIQRRLSKDTLTPGMGMQLKRIYNSLEDGMSTPGDWFKGEAAADGETKPEGRKRPGSKKKENTEKVSASELDMIRKKAKASEISEVEICKAFKVGKLEELISSRAPAVLKWLGDPTSTPE